MIVRKNGTFEVNSDFPNINWYPKEDNYIVDETTEEGQLMMATYINSYPLVTFEHDGKYVTSVSIINLQKPPEVVGKEIQLIKNGQGQWEYVYVDIPLSDIELLKQQLAEQQAIINSLLGVTE